MASEKVVPDQEVSTNLLKCDHRRTCTSELEGREVVIKKWCLKSEVSEEV